MVSYSNTKTVMKEFKEEMFPQTISNKLDLLAEKITQMSARMEETEKRVEQLETKVEQLEIALDSHEQYSRRANLRINGMRVFQTWLITQVTAARGAACQFPSELPVCPGCSVYNSQAA